MRSFVVPILVLAFLFLPGLALADDVTVTGTVRFETLDGSAQDHDGAADGVFTVDDGDLIVDGKITCSDDAPLPGPASACPIAIAVSGDLIVEAGGSIVAENLRGGGLGGDISLDVGGNLALRGPDGAAAGALISSSRLSSFYARAGNIGIDVQGSVLLEAGSVIAAGANKGTAGTIQVTAGGGVTVAGLVAAGTGRAVQSSKLTGRVLATGDSRQQGGPVILRSASTDNPAIRVDASGIVVSQGEDLGAGMVLLEGCGIEVRGLVAAVSKNFGPAVVALRSGEGLLVDGRDLGVAGSGLTRLGRVRADAIQGGAVGFGVDLFAKGDVAVFGPSTGLFAVSSVHGSQGNQPPGGTIAAISLDGALTASGNAFEVGKNKSGNRGGTIDLQAKGDVTLDDARLRAVGGTNGKGGTIAVRSFQGSLSWPFGVGDVRPVGTGVSADKQGAIRLTACAGIDTTGTQFPVNGSPIPPFPEEDGDDCSLPGPVLPEGEPDLPVCRRSPTADDQSVTTAEETPVTITLTGSDPNGDPLTFSIVDPPDHGTLGPLTPLTPTSAQVLYTPDADYEGPDSFDFQVDDGNGGTDVGTVSITVTGEDDPPTAVDDTATVAEDSGANAIDVLANDTDPDGGPKSVNSVTQPANGTVVITGGGTGLTYQPNPNYCNSPSGSPDTFTYTLAPGGSTATVSVTVTCVDDDPVAVADAATVAEDSGANAIDVLANDTDVDGGPASVDSVTQPANGTVVITGGGTGVTYQPNANYCNSDSGPADTFTYTLAPGGSSTTVTVTVTCVDDDPVAVADSATVVEDSGANAVDVLANDTDVDGGPKSVSSVTQPANGTVVITGGGTGLTYQPNANYCNSDSGPADTFTYTLSPGGSSTTVTVTVTCVDDDPVAVADAATVDEDSGANAIDVLANDTDVDGGPKSVGSVTQPANGAVVITGGGTGLTYQPNADYCNSLSGVPDTFTYTLSPGGSSTTVTVTVLCVDDNPVAVADAATVNEDSGANAVDVLANDTDVDGGPKSVNSVTQPANGAVVITGGGTGLTYQPNLNYCNSISGPADTFTYTLAPGGSSTTVSVTVVCVNDPPVADNDTFDTIGNTELRVDLDAVETPHVLETTPTTFGVLDGDSDPVEGSPITLSGVVGCGDISAPFECPTAHGGTVVVEANGRFSFTPAAGDTAASDSFQYRITDGTDEAIATVTIHRFERVWYVSNDATAGGLGRSNDPFDTLAEAQAASSANDFIFVHFGDGTSADQDAGIVLKSGQRLIGEHAGLSIPVSLNGNGATTELVAAAPGNRPLIDNPAGSAVSATDAIPAAIVGLSLSGSANAIDVTTNAAFPGSGTLTIAGNVVRSAGGEGIDVNAGGTGTLTLALSNTSVTSTGTSIDVARTGGTLVLSAFDNLTVSGDTGGSGIVVTGPASFDSTPGGGLDPIAAGNLVIGASGNTVGGAGLALLTVSGTLNFADIDIFAGGGAGLRLAGTGTANTNLTVGAGVGIIEAAGGPAADLSSATVNLQLTSLTSTSSATTGVSLTTINGTFSAGTGSSIVNAAGTDFAIDGGTANVTYNGTITDDVGQLVSIANTTAGTKSFGGAITDGNDGDGNGISLASNTGATVNFTGGLTLSTGANPAFAATGGGTLHVSGAAVNTIATTTATALNISNTTIHASGVTFRSIASNGGGNTGIVLNNTGASGGLTVAGTGGAGTGGTIQNKTVDGISLINTRGVSLSSMVIDNNDGSGIFGDDVTDFSLIGSSVTNNADSTGGTEAGLRFNELLGTCAITNTTVGGSHEDNVRLTPASGVLSNLAVSGSTFGPNPVGTGANGIAIVATGTAALTVNVTASTFDGNQTSGFLTSFGNSATGTINISGSTISDNNIGIDLGTGLNSDQTFNLSNNTLLRHNSNAINIVTAGNNTNASQFRGTISGNQIGDGTADSGSRTSFGIAVDLRGDVDAAIAITNNTVRNTDIEGIFVQSRLDNDADAEVGQLDLTLTGNVARIPDDNSAFPFGAVYGTRIEARNTTVLCLDIASNDAESVGAFEDIRVRQRDTSTFRLERFVGSGTTDTDVESFLVGQNPLIVDADATHATTFTGVANGFCEKP